MAVRNGSGAGRQMAQHEIAVLDGRCRHPGAMPVAMSIRSDIVAGMYWAAGLTNATINGVAANPNPAHVLNLSIGESEFDLVWKQGATVVSEVKVPKTPIDTSSGADKTVRYPELAKKIAHSEADLHHAVELVLAGCTHETAAEILL